MITTLAPENLLIAELATKEPSRFALNGVRVWQDSRKTIKCTVTDGFSLLSVDCPKRPEHEPFPKYAFVIPSATCIDLAKKDCEVPVTVDESAITLFAPSDTRTVTSLGNGPEIDRVMPDMANYPTSICLDLDKLIPLLQTMRKAIKHGTKKGKYGYGKATTADFAVRGDRHALVITARTEKAELDLFGMLMPIKK